MNATTRLDDIADRNSRSRVLDVAFAAVIAILMMLCLVSLRDAAGGDLRANDTASSADHSGVVVADSACDVDSTHC
jgi:hypothetical protein